MSALHPQYMQSQDTGFESHASKPSSESPLSKEAEKRNANNLRDEERRRKRKRNIIIAAVVVVLIVALAVAIPVGVVLSNQNSSGNGNSGDTGDGAPASASAAPKSAGHYNVPQKYLGTYLDPATWYTTLDFNTTFTDETVGGLYIMGLNSTWDDTTQANPGVPALNEKWDYGTKVFRGTNMGGQLTLEPFLTPSFWDVYPISKGIIDEWTLCEHLGPEVAKSTLEKHYATFSSESDYAAIAAAGFDHVRIPFSYWAVKVYSGEPYVPQVSFRYLLRDIEWARKYGLRVFIDLHAVPGSQNGWTHSGHVGSIGWLHGPDGALNGERSTEIHDQLSQFFSQPRYKNIISHYGLVNEPYMPTIGTSNVIDWYNKVIPIVRKNGIDCLIVISDGFITTEKWTTTKPTMTSSDNVIIDIHQYIVYDDGTLSMIHEDKISYACDGFSTQAAAWTAAFGPSMYGEWSVADTECALYQNGVGVGSRWNGTYEKGTGPQCPTYNGQCDCSPAIADPKTFSPEYKTFIQTFLAGQIDSFNKGWGWFHWTWKADDLTIAPSWTYTGLLAAEAVPKNINDVTWTCAADIPNFAGAGLSELY